MFLNKEIEVPFLIRNTKDGYNENLYGRYDGGSVILIYNDHFLNQEVFTQYTGSFEGFKDFVFNIAQNYNLSPKDITMAWGDYGSFSAKPSSINGNYNVNQHAGFNTLEKIIRVCCSFKQRSKF